jgi:hypothetical protein
VPEVAALEDGVQRATYFHLGADAPRVLRVAGWMFSTMRP